MSRGIQELSIDTTLLYDRLRKMEVGEIVNYDELSKIIHRDVRSCRGLLATARRKALRDDEIVIDCVHGEGVKRLDDVGVVETLSTALRAIRKKSRKATNRVVGIKNYDQLSGAVKIQHNTYLSLLGAISSFSQASNQKKLESKISQSQSKLSLQETINLFSG